MPPFTVEPFVALMRRYCIDYTNVHDLTVCDQIMSDDYRITISGRTMGMDGYPEAVAAAYRRYPTLMLTVHDLVLSGDRLAMHFSEHGAPAEDPEHVAVWSGISLYRWDGDVLLDCRVEQDFLGRDEQSATGATAPLLPGHPDPWATTRDRAPDPDAEAAVRRWLDRYQREPDAALASPEVTVLETGQGAPLLGDIEIVVDDLFSAGDRVAAALTVHGRYLGGLEGLADEALGLPGELPVTVLARVVGDEVVDLKLVRDRWGLLRRLRRALRT